MVKLLLNPWFLLSALLVLGGTTATAYYYGGKHKANAIAAQDLRERELIDKVILKTGEAIADIEVKHTTIRQRVQETIRENTVYRDCKHDDATFGLLNDALANRGAQPVDPSGVPATD